MKFNKEYMERLRSTNKYYPEKVFLETNTKSDKKYTFNKYYRESFEEQLKLAKNRRSEKIENIIHNLITPIYALAIGYGVVIGGVKIIERYQKNNETKEIYFQKKDSINKLYKYKIDSINNVHNHKLDSLKKTYYMNDSIEQKLR